MPKRLFFLRHWELLGLLQKYLQVLHVRLVHKQLLRQHKQW